MTQPNCMLSAHACTCVQASPEAAARESEVRSQQTPHRARGRGGRGQGCWQGPYHTTARNHAPQHAPQVTINVFVLCQACPPCIVPTASTSRLTPPPHPSRRNVVRSSRQAAQLRSSLAQSSAALRASQAQLRRLEGEVEQLQVGGGGGGLHAPRERTAPAPSPRDG